MKITDKIVTSKIQPQQTNVVWHNPDTGELRMFSEKGWELAGGGKLPEIVESGWVLDKETGGIIVKYELYVPNVLKYGGNPGPPSWWFSRDTDLEVGQVIQVVDGDGNSITITVLSKSYYGFPVYSFDGDLDTSKTYSYGAYEFNISNTASGVGSVASGKGTTAEGDYAHAEGYKTTASSAYQHVQGKCNIADDMSIYSFIIGNGAEGALSNAFAVKWDGSIVLWKDANTPLELTPSKLEKLLALVD